MFFELIKKRRSQRNFRSEKIEKEKIESLVEAALRAPSSRGLNPWRFIVIDDPDMLEKLSASKPHGASFLKNAPLGIVVCASEEESDVWVEDTSIASIFIHLAAEALDLGSCWIQIRKRAHNRDMSAETYIRNLLNIPETIKVESIMAIGYPDHGKPPHPKASLQTEKVFFNRFDET